MADDNLQAVEDMLTKLIAHVGDTMAEVQRLSPGWTWHHVFSACVTEDDPRAPDQRTTFTPFDQGGGPRVLRMFSVSLMEIAENWEAGRVRSDDA